MRPAADTRSRRPFTERAARACARHPWPVIVVWMVVLGASLGMYLLFQDGFKAEDSFLNNPESRQADTLVAERMGGANHETEVVVVRSSGLKSDDPAFRALVTGLARRMAALNRHVVGVTTPYNAPKKMRPYLVAKNGRTVILPVELAGTVNDADQHIEPVWRIVDKANKTKGFEVAITGGAAWERDAQEIAGSDLRQAELIGIPAALVILVIVFGALVAASLPIVLAVFAIVVAMALTALIGQAFTVSVFALNIITMMGLAVGIDYSLFIISRYREERRNGLEKAEAVGRAAATAGKAVMFSGVTVVLALCGMLIVPFSIFPSLGIGAIAVVAATMVASMTLLPAIVSLLGDRVNSLRVPYLGRRLIDPGKAAHRGTRHDGTAAMAAEAGPGGRAGWWGRTAGIIMRHPVVSLLLGGSLLIAIAVPTLFMERGATGVSALPDNLGTKRGFVMLQRDFSAGWTGPVQVVVDGPLLNPGVLAALQRFNTAITKDGRFQAIGFTTSSSGTLAVIELMQDEAPTSQRALDNIGDLRHDIIPAAFDGSPAKVYVGGTSATYYDGFAIIDRYMPIVIAMVLALSFVLLLIAFRSLLAAVTATIMNLLAVGASYGALTLVFQFGWAASLFGFTKVDLIESWVPLLMYCVLFGISMDYQVFLLSRIRERWADTGDSRGAVAFGIQSTAGIITGAALIMMAVFAGMAAGEMVMFQQIGFGLAVAVLLDATVIQTVVVPATIALIGDRYWWLPSWLGWLPKVSVEGTQNAAGGSAALDGRTAASAGARAG